MNRHSCDFFFNNVRAVFRIVISINVKKRFLRFFISVTFFNVFQRFFLFSKRFFYSKKSWQCSERQAD